jgi:aspartyl/asparaginyl beta-hydroxylase (cupin superfamily)
VGRESTSWAEGKFIVFDDAFIHSAENLHPTKDRHVLILQFFKPGVCALPGVKCSVHLKWRN